MPSRMNGYRALFAFSFLLFHFISNVLLMKSSGLDNRLCQLKSTPIIRWTIQFFPNLQAYIRQSLLIKLYYFKTCLHRSSLGLMNLLRLDRCLVYIGLNYIDIEQMGLYILSGLVRFQVYSEFCLVRFQVYSEFCFVMFEVYSGFCLVRFQVYSEFCLVRFQVYSEFCLVRFQVYSEFCLVRFQVYSEFCLVRFQVYS